MTPPKPEKSTPQKQSNTSTFIPAKKNLEEVKKILEKARKVQ